MEVEGLLTAAFAVYTFKFCQGNYFSSFFLYRSRDDGTPGAGREREVSEVNITAAKTVAPSDELVPEEELPSFGEEQAAVVSFPGEEQPVAG